MSKNVMEPEGPQMAIWRLVSCWISKTTCAQAHSSACASTHVGTRAHAHTQMYVRLTGLFTATVVSSARLIVTLHVHCLSYFTFFFIYFCPCCCSRHSSTFLALSYPLFVASSSTPAIHSSCFYILCIPSPFLSLTICQHHYCDLRSCVASVRDLHP